MWIVLYCIVLAKQSQALSYSVQVFILKFSSWFFRFQFFFLFSFIACFGSIDKKKRKMKRLKHIYSKVCMKRSFSSMNPIIRMIKMVYLKSSHLFESTMDNFYFFFFSLFLCIWCQWRSRYYCFLFYWFYSFFLILSFMFFFLISTSQSKRNYHYCMQIYFLFLFYLRLFDQNWLTYNI